MISGEPRFAGAGHYSQTGCTGLRPEPSHPALPSARLRPSLSRRASARRGGMVGQRAPSRPFRVTIPFASSSGLVTGCPKSIHLLQISSGVNCPARARGGRQPPAFWEPDATGDHEIAGCPGDHAWPGDSGKPNAPGLWWAAAGPQPVRGPPVPRINRKMRRRLRGRVLARAGLRAAPPPCRLDFPVDRFPPCPRREAVRQVRRASARLPCRTAPSMKAQRGAVLPSIFPVLSLI